MNKSPINRQTGLISFAIFLFAFCLPLLSEEYAPNIVIFDQAEDSGAACAREIADLIFSRQSHGLSTVLGLATGSSPLPMYKAFTKLVQEENLDLSEVITFNLDEYCGLPPSHPESYYAFMFSNLFNKIIFSDTNPNGLRLENIYIPDGYAKKLENLSVEELSALNQEFPERKKLSSLTTEEEFWVLKQRAKKYEALIHELGPINLQLLGIGTNGHIGFAEPGSSLESRTMLVKLSENTRLDNARFFNHEMDQVPKYAITMGIETILQAEKIVLVASGQTKAKILEKTLSSPISSEIPATALRMHPDVSFFLDTYAASAIVN